MRAAMATALTGLFLIATGVPVAAAEPTAPPEAPPGGVVFTDNPAIVDPHPIAVESWSRAATDNAGRPSGAQRNVTTLDKNR